MTPDTHKRKAQHTPHVTIVVHHPATHADYHVTLPARSHHDAWAVLEGGAQGSAMGAWRTTELSRIAQKVRSDYKKQLEDLDARIVIRQKELAQGRVSKEELWRWAVVERTKFGRTQRLATAKAGAPVSAIMPELRDQAKYGLGGRTPENLWARAKKSLGETASDEAVMDRLIAGATRSNTKVSYRLAEFARYLETGRPLVFATNIKISPNTALKGLGAFGVAAGAYEIVTAKPEERGSIARRLGLEWVGGALASEAVVFGLVAFSATPMGWVVAAGLLAGAVGSGGGDLADWFLFDPNRRVHAQIKQSGVVDSRHLSRKVPHGASGSW